MNAAAWSTLRSQLVAAGTSLHEGVLSPDQFVNADKDLKKSEIVVHAPKAAKAKKSEIRARKPVSA